jgi:malonate transporter and related proteins
MSLLVSFSLAILPIALMIAAGFAMRRLEFVEESFWAPAEKLCYFICLPALFIHALATVDLSGQPIFKMSVALMSATFLGAIVALLITKLMGLKAPELTSVFQGSIRFNNYIGISGIVGLFGTSALAKAAIVNAALVPWNNVLCVFVFAYFGERSFAPLAVLRGLVMNPLVVSCLVGIALQASGIGLPLWIDPFLKALGSAALPLGLLCVGAALCASLRQDRLMTHARLIGAACLTKFLLLPLIMLGIGIYAGFDRQTIQIMMLFQTLPTAASSYIMARQLGGNANLMAAIITFQTLFAVLILPIMLVLIPV